MNMNETKSALASKGLWGAVLVVVAQVALIFDAPGVAKWAANPDSLTQVLYVASIVGAAVSFYGRYVATKTIEPVLPPASGKPPGGPPALAVLALASVLTLGACAKIDGALSTQNPITMRTVFALQATYNATFLVPAANYRRLGICPAGVKFTVAAPCADREVVAKLQKVDLAAKKAIGELKAFVQAYPGQLGAQGLYDAASLSIRAANAVLAARDN